MSKESIPAADQELVASANHVLWYYVRGGYPPGSFTENLIRTMDSADQWNFARLEGAFPSLASCVYQAKHVSGGLDRLREIAAGGGN